MASDSEKDRKLLKEDFKSSSDDERFTTGINLLEVKDDNNVAPSFNSSSSSSPDSDTPSFRDDTSSQARSQNLEVSDVDVVSAATSAPMVPLEPFVHQVGGHFPMVCLATETICKPLNDREHNFYQTLPVVLHPYTPRFEGIMSVALHEDENGYITLMGTPPNCYGLKQNKSVVRSLKTHQQMLLLHHHIQQEQLKDCFYGKTSKYPHHIRLKRTDSLEIERADSPAIARSVSVPASVPASSTGSPREKMKPDIPESADAEAAESSCLAELLTTFSCPTKYYFYATPEEIEEEKEMSECPKEEIYCNPWALKCHRHHLKKLGLLSSAHSSHSGGSNSPTGCANNATQLYLLLENLVSKYSRPCVLDLKVGSRQYPDDVSAAKKQRKIVKSANTTSASLGLRLCGMQVYNVATGKYLCHNKYYGRSLSPVGFKTTIAEFLNNDSSDQLRVDVINQLLEKLTKLVEILQQLESFRFYTSSLLVTYDGAAATGNKQAIKSVDRNVEEDLVDVRIIDFAHSTHKGLKDSTLHVGPDRGFIDGIQNFIVILNEIKEPNNFEKSQDEEKKDK